MRSSTKALESISVCNQLANQKYPHCNSWTLKYDWSVKEGTLSSRVEAILKMSISFPQPIRGKPINIPSMDFIPNLSWNFAPRIPIKMGSHLRWGAFWIRSHRDSRRSRWPARPTRSRLNPYWWGSHWIKVQVPQRGWRRWNRRSVARRHLVRWVDGDDPSCQPQLYRWQPTQWRQKSSSSLDSSWHHQHIINDIIRRHPTNALETLFATTLLIRRPTS